MVKNIEQKFAPDLAVLINSSCFLRRQDSSYFNGQTGEIGVMCKKVQYSNIAYRILRTSLTLNDTGIFPKGAACVVEGDVSNGTKRRIYFVMEDWKVYNYQPLGDV